MCRSDRSMISDYVVHMKKECPKSRKMLLVTFGHFLASQAALVNIIFLLFFWLSFPRVVHIMFLSMHTNHAERREASSNNKDTNPSNHEP